MQVHKSSSPSDTQNIARSLASGFKNGGIIALSGELGAGKTTFIQGFAEGLDIREKIISPTFLLMRQYPIPNQKNFFYHIDLYRLEIVDPKNLGLEEVLNDPANVVLIEWAEKIGNKLSPKAAIKIKHLGENLRELTVNLYDV